MTLLTCLSVLIYQDVLKTPSCPDNKAVELLAALAGRGHFLLWGLCVNMFGCFRSVSGDFFSSSKDVLGLHI